MSVYIYIYVHILFINFLPYNYTSANIFPHIYLFISLLFYILTLQFLHPFIFHLFSLLFYHFIYYKILLFSLTFNPYFGPHKKVNTHTHTHTHTLSLSLSLSLSLFLYIYILPFGGFLNLYCISILGYWIFCVEHYFRLMQFGCISRSLKEIIIITKHHHKFIIDITQTIYNNLREYYSNNWYALLNI